MNTTTSLNRPLTTAIRELKEATGLTFQEIAQCSGSVRSHGWFAKLLRVTDPADVSPPKDRKHINGLAELLGCTEEDVRNMIALEWFGIVRTEVSHRGRVAAALADQLSSQEWEAVQTVLRRMTKDAQPKSRGDAGSL